MWLLSIFVLFNPKYTIILSINCLTSFFSFQILNSNSNASIIPWFLSLIVYIFLEILLTPYKHIYMLSNINGWRLETLYRGTFLIVQSLRWRSSLTISSFLFSVPDYFICACYLVAPFVPRYLNFDCSSNGDYPLFLISIGLCLNKCFWSNRWDMLSTKTFLF